MAAVPSRRSYRWYTSAPHVADHLGVITLKWAKRGGLGGQRTYLSHALAYAGRARYEILKEKSVFAFLMRKAAAQHGSNDGSNGWSTRVSISPIGHERDRILMRKIRICQALTGRWRGLLNRYRSNPIEGSNPSLPASPHRTATQYNSSFATKAGELFFVRKARGVSYAARSVFGQ
jgi:hypothetical protein